LINKPLVVNKIFSLTGDQPLSLSTKVFLRFCIGFNLLFLIYVIGISYYNELALDDFGYLWVRRNFGAANPYSYWYLQWQGRFGPHVLRNIIFFFYDITGSLFFYPVLLSGLFIYCIYQILKFYFSIPRLVLVTYTILLFSAVLLTTFDLSTFFWIHSSPNYFGGVAFALLGWVLILRDRFTIANYAGIALCFLYAGSSSEHVGAVLWVILLVGLSYIFFSSAYRFADFTSHVRSFIAANKKLFTALAFCTLAFIIMIFAPGTKVRMYATQQLTDPVQLLRTCFDSTKFVCYHILYKLPYFLLYVPLFMLFGSQLKSNRITCRLNFIYVFVFAALGACAFIFLTSIPVVYATSRIGPLRSYVYVNFLLVAILFLLCIYASFYYRSRLKNFSTLAAISVAVLFMFVLYTSARELILVKTYNKSLTDRLALLQNYKQQGRTEAVYLEPLFVPEYTSITDVWRSLSRTDKLPSAMSEMPIVSAEIGNPPDWTNEQLKRALELPFDVLLAPADPKSK
jgi:hypothetical protein